MSGPSRCVECGHTASEHDFSDNPPICHCGCKSFLEFRKKAIRMPTLDGVRMDDSPVNKKVYEAIYNVQQACGIIGKDAFNPHFKSKFVSLETLWDKVKPLLKKNGLVVIQVPKSIVSGTLIVDTIIRHVESGETVIFPGAMPIGQGNGPQAVGSAITYARRYLLAPILGVVTGDEDDDGESAEGRGKAAKEPVKKAAEPPKSPSAPSLAERKKALLRHMDDKIVKEDHKGWLEGILKRTVDASVTLNNVAELEALEAEMQKILKSGLFDK